MKSQEVTDSSKVSQQQIEQVKDTLEDCIKSSLVAWDFALTLQAAIEHYQNIDTHISGVEVCKLIADELNSICETLTSIKVKLKYGLTD